MLLAKFSWSVLSFAWSFFQKKSRPGVIFLLLLLFLDSHVCCGFFGANSFEVCPLLFFHFRTSLDCLCGMSQSVTCPTSCGDWGYPAILSNSHCKELMQLSLWHSYIVISVSLWYLLEESFVLFFFPSYIFWRKTGKILFLSCLNVLSYIAVSVS